MNRITTLNKEGQQRMIHYLSAWFKYTQFSHYKKSISKYILNSVIMLTNHHVNLRPDLIQLLWHSIANYSNNVRITTNYLVETAIERVIPPFSSLFLLFLPFPLFLLPFLFLYFSYSSLPSPFPLALLSSHLPIFPPSPFPPTWFDEMRATVV